MKKIISLLILITFMISCKEHKNLSFDSEKESITSVLEKFPMIDKKLTSVRKITLDSLSITLLRNPNKKAFDEILVFEKKNKFYAIPFFSNMYADYWNFENDKQPNLFPKTNSTFEKEFSSVITALNLLIKELMFSILHAENKLNDKLSMLQNKTFFSVRVDKHKIEETDSCNKRTNIAFDQIAKDYNSKSVIIRFQYYLDQQNGRIYKIENKGNKENELKIAIKTYRIDCYMYIYEL
jgi:hypothetical protein